MCSWDTKREDVDAFVGDAKECRRTRLNKLICAEAAKLICEMLGAALPLHRVFLQAVEANGGEIPVCGEFHGLPMNRFLPGELWQDFLGRVAGERRAARE